MAVHAYGVQIRCDGEDFVVSSATSDEKFDCEGVDAEDFLGTPFEQIPFQKLNEIQTKLRHCLSTSIVEPGQFTEIILSALEDLCEWDNFDSFGWQEIATNPTTCRLQAVAWTDDDEADEYENHLLQAAENGEWWALPEKEPSNAHEIIDIATEEYWPWTDLCTLPSWLSDGITRAAEEEAHYDYYYNRSHEYDDSDFDFAYNSGKYAEDSWAAYGNYVLDH